MVLQRVERGGLLPGGVRARRHRARSSTGGCDRRDPRRPLCRRNLAAGAPPPRPGLVRVRCAARRAVQVAHVLRHTRTRLVGRRVPFIVQGSHEMMLEDKVAVIYGAGGAIGGAVALAFAREGAKLFLAGRHLAPVNTLAKDIVGSGASAEAAEVDVLDEQAVDKHLQSVIDSSGRVDISFNAIGIPDMTTLGVPMVELDVEQFSQPITTYTRSYFLTARLAARRMLPNKSGVIMTVTTLHSRTGIPQVGGYGAAQAAKEALTGDLSAELAPQGIRVVGLRPQAMPESVGSKRRFAPRAKASGMTWEKWQELLASRTHPRRLMTLQEMANVAVFMASDQASGMTGTTINLTMGGLDD